MTHIFSSLPGFRHLIAYWYHFAIMFEALFILTTVDAGTRVARFLVQESLGRLRPRWGRTDWLPGALVATGAVCAVWGYLVWTGSVKMIWPLLGITNQLLACIALCTGTAMLVRAGRSRYAWVTLVPLLFVGTATETAGWQLVTGQFVPKLIRSGDAAQAFQGWVLSTICVVAMVALVVIVFELALTWARQPLDKRDASSSI